PAWSGRWSVALAIPAAAVALWLQPTEATVIAGALAALTLVAARLGGPGLTRPAAWLVALVLLVPPLIAAALPSIYDPATLAALPQSHAHRVQIWTYALDLILQRPLFGWGFDSARELMGTGDGAVFAGAPMSTHTH